VLYAGAQALVHLALRRDNRRPAAQVGALRAPGAGVVDHVAFRIADARAIRQRLKDCAWSYHEANVPGRGERQFFIAIPEGQVVELVTAVH